jgi:hypothetical protein
MFSVVALLALNTAFSQINKTEYELIKDQFKLEKKAVVAEVLNLKGAEETNFWPLYNAYEEERTKISKGSWDLLEKYASRYDSLTGAEAQSMVTKSIAINQQLLKLRDTYLKSMSQKVSPGTAARFIQLEDYLYTLLRSELFESVPIFGQLKK